MKIGVRAHDFGRRDAKELPQMIKNAGFDTVQLALTKAITGIQKFVDIKDNHLEAIRNAFEKNAVEINVLGCYIEPSLQNQEERLANVENFKKGIEHAKKLGVSIVGTETTNFSTTDEGKREAVYQLLKDSVLRMVEKAEKENITIGIEPVAEHTLDSPQLTRRLLDEIKSEKLKIIFDPVNLLLPQTAESQRSIFEDCFALFGQEIVAVHLKDIVISQGEKQWRNIGKGVVDYPFIFDWLHKHKEHIAVLREGVKMDSFGEDLEAIRRLAEYK